MTRPDWWTPEYEAAALEGVADGIAARHAAARPEMAKRAPMWSAQEQDRTAIDDRRQSAREAAQDSADVTQSWALGAIEVGIEVATRVKITDDIIETAQQAEPFWNSVDEARPVLIAAFRAAGFEVVE